MSRRSDPTDIELAAARRHVLGLGETDLIAASSGYLTASVLIIAAHFDDGDDERLVRELRKARAHIEAVTTVLDRHVRLAREGRPGGRS